MFDRLLLSKGGGIIADVQKAEQSDRAIIAIGLGGTGIKCLKTLKEEVYDRVKPDAGTDGSVPKYRRIKFLAIDTDDIDDLFDESEQCKIRQESITTILNNRESYVTNDSSLKWLGTRAEMAPRNNVGAGGVRQIGRLCLFRNSQIIINRLKDLITDATTVEQGQNNNPPEIYFQIFTGLSGGTGSGCFIDICYIIRGLLKEQGRNNNDKILGYFFLPDFNDDGSSYKVINGYAALKELDYCMNYNYNGDEWTQEYRGLARPVKENCAPVDYAHIISKKNTEGAQTDNPQEVAISAVVDYVLEYMTKTAAAVNTNTQTTAPNAGNQQNNVSTKDFDIISHLSNINQYIDNAVKNYGSNYNYCIIGASRAYLPYKEINTYAASKVFESFKYLKNTLPSGQNVKDFISTGKFELKNIEDEIKEGLPDIPPADATWEEVQQALNAGLIQDADSFPDCINNVSGGRRLVKAATGESIRDGSFGIIEKNKEALKGTNGGLVNSNHNIKSLIDRIKIELESVLRDPNKGPYYASALLNGNNETNIKDSVSGDIAETESKLINAKRTYTECRDKVEKAIKDMTLAFNKKFFGAAKAKQESVDTYIYAIHEMLKQEREIKALENVRDVLIDLNTSGKLNALSNEFKKYTDRFDELYQTFDENIRHINATATAKQNKNVIKIVDINDPTIKNFLDNQVKNQIGNGRSLVADFISDMIEKEEKAQSNGDVFEEKELVDFTKSFFIERLKNITNNSLTKYFEIYFQTQNPAVLAQKIEDQYVSSIGNSSIPYMWSSNKDEASLTETGFITYPQAALAVKTAVENYQQKNSAVFSSNGNKPNIRPSYLTDSISTFRFICGVSLFNYNGSILYRSDYEGGLSAGTHLYENVDDQPVDFRKLKTIIPLRMLIQEDVFKDDREKGSNDSFINDLDNYFTEIIKIDPVTQEKFFKKYNEVLLSEYEQEIDALEKGEKDFSNTDLGFKIMDKDNITANGEEIQTASKCNNSIIGDIIKDIIYSSMVYEDEAKKQINNCKRYEEIKLKYEKIEKRVRSLLDFVNIYSRGIIIKDSDELHKLDLNYKDENGDEQTIELSNARKEFGESFELYSAYLSFSGLDEKILKSIFNYIDTELKGKVDSDSSMLRKELEDTKESINRRIKNIVDAEDRMEIEKFYKELRKTNESL